MKKLLLVALILASAASAFAQLTCEEVAQFYIGMTKSEVEKILQKNAIRRGVSFSLENYKTNQLENIQMPDEVLLEASVTEAYIIDQTQIVLEKGIVSILALSAEKECLNSILQAYKQKYGEVKETQDVYYFEDEDMYLIIRKHLRNTEINALRRSYLPERFVKQLHNKEDEAREEIYTVDDYTVVADSAATVYNYDNKMASNKLFLPLTAVTQLDHRSTIDDFKKLINQYVDTENTINLDKCVNELTESEKSKFIFDNKELVRYELSGNIFFFREGKYIGGNWLVEKTSKNGKEIDELRELLDNKHDGHKVSKDNENLSIWMNSYSMVAFEDNDDYLTITVAMAEDFKKEAWSKLENSLTEPKAPYDFNKLLSMNLGMSKDEVINIIREATANDNFNLEICKKPYKKHDFPKNEELDINEYNTALYEWNDIGLILSHNKLNALLVEKRNISDKDYNTFQQLIENKLGKSQRFKKGDIWIDDTQLTYIQHGKKISYIIVNRQWLTQDEIDQVINDVKEDNRN